MSPLAFPVFLEEVLELYSTGKHALDTFRRMNQVLRAFAALPGVASTADLTTRNMARYVTGLGLETNPNTVNGELGYLRAACGYAIEEGYLDRQPAWRRVRLRPRKMTLNPPCTVRQLRRLLKWLSTQATGWTGRRIYVLTSTIALTGARRNEVLLAQREDLDLPGRRLLLVERRERFKTEKSATFVPLPDALVPLLQAWLPEVADTPWLFPGIRKRGPWTGGECGHRAIDELRQAAAQVGIKRVTWHGLRHSYATNALVHFKVPIWAVQATLRHSDIRTTQRYMHDASAAELVQSVRHMAY